MTDGITSVIYGLTLEDIEFFRKLKKDFLGKKSPPSSTPSNSYNSENYVVLTGSEGIPARSGTTPGRANCSIYQIDPYRDSATLVPVSGLDQIINNLDTTAVPGDVYRLVAKDKYGEWIIASTAMSEGAISNFEIVSTLAGLDCDESGAYVVRVLYSIRNAGYVTVTGTVFDESEVGESGVTIQASMPAAGAGLNLEDRTTSGVGGAYSLTAYPYVDRDETGELGIYIQVKISSLYDPNPGKEIVVNVLDSKVINFQKL